MANENSNSKILFSIIMGIITAIVGSAMLNTTAGIIGGIVMLVFLLCLMIKRNHSYKNIMRLVWKKTFRYVLFAVFMLISVIGLCYLIVSINASNKTFNRIDNIPQNKVGLLLGTSPVTPHGEHNYYFDNRIYATVELYEQGVRHE